MSQGLQQPLDPLRGEEMGSFLELSEKKAAPLHEERIRAQGDSS